MLKFIFYVLFSLGLSFFNVWVMFFGMMIFVVLLMVMELNLFMLNNVSMTLGVDFLGGGLIILSAWICGLMVLASMMIISSNCHSKFFFFINLLLLLFLTLTFSSMDMFYFYFFFESSMVPVLLMIMGWGGQPERIQAGVYLIFYTLLVSLPLFLGIYFILNSSNSVSFYLVSGFSYCFLYFVMILAFLVKMPMYFVHLWLPKAHVEAPVAGSMILAGVMLKLGGYGLMRVLKVVELVGVRLNLYWVIISLIGSLFMSLICFRQIDMKSLIACSSVVHMAMVIGGIMTLNYFGFVGSYVLMIGHGLCSSGLFILVNLIYERTGSRSLMINKGLLNIFPNLTLWWSLLVFANMAAPPSLNLLGEISLMISITAWSWSMLWVLGLVSFLSAGYSLFIYIYSQHGKMMFGVYSLGMIESREYLVLCLHWVPLNLLILKIDYFYLWV
uniref:NADH-ubiquinone oxidoreductase chain 4 n=1 Tax=Parapsyche difformis TaxID=2904886 RepID=A0A9E8LNK5_9NEOP|nr:NADH dehydrogenase subunit 4 [Parapsyche difformis]UZZ43683.1 NADH dehydrogenase subunit 4 [Parapsyche difformis]